MLAYMPLVWPLDTNIFTDLSLILNKSTKVYMFRYNAFSKIGGWGIFPALTLIENHGVFLVFKQRQ